MTTLGRCSVTLTADTHILVFMNYKFTTLFVIIRVEANLNLSFSNSSKYLQKNRHMQSHEYI